MANYQSNLINEIKKYPCLYIKDNAVFRDPISKNDAWIKISRKLKLEVKLLQKEWRKLQECYKVILVARRKYSRASKKLWKFEEQMKFMEYYLRPKMKSPPTDSLKEENMVVPALEPELMEISSSVITSNTSEPEVAMTSNTSKPEVSIASNASEPEVVMKSNTSEPEVVMTSNTSEPEAGKTSEIQQKYEIPSQSCATPSTENRVIVGDKAPFPGDLPRNTSPFCSLPTSCHTAPMETVPPESRAPQTDEKPETSGVEDAPIPEPIETELMIVYDSYQEGNRISSSDNVGFREGSGVISRMENAPLPESSTETTQVDVMIVYDGNPLHNRIPRRKNVDLHVIMKRQNE